MPDYLKMLRRKTQSTSFTETRKVAQQIDNNQIKCSTSNGLLVNYLHDR